MPIFDRNLRTVRRDVARALNDLMLVGTAINPATASVETFNGIFQDAKLLEGKHLYIDNGALAQESRAIYSATICSPASTTGAVLSPIPYFSGQPSTNTEFAVFRNISGDLYTQAIQSAVRRAASKLLQEERHHEVLGSHLKNGLFSRWTNSSSPPEGWTNTQGQTRLRRGAYPGGRYLFFFSTTGGQIALEQSTTKLPYEWINKTITFKAIVNAYDTGRVFLRIDDGIGTTDSDTHGTPNGEGDEELSVTRTIVDTATEIKFQVRTNNTVIGHVKKAWTVGGPPAPSVYVPQDFIWLNAIRKEGGTDGVFNSVIPDRWYYVTPQRIASDASQTLEFSDDIARVVFLTNMFDPDFHSGKVVELVGLKNPAVPSAETDNLEIDPEYVVSRAMQELYAYLPWGEQDVKAWQTKHAAAFAKAERYERDLVNSSRPPVGSIRVRIP